MDGDVELSSMPTGQSRLEVYPTFAEFIAKDKDAAIYHRFKHLSAHNLLYLQSELHNLEQQLEMLDYKDAKEIGDLNAQSAARYWRNYAYNTDQQSVLRRELQLTIKVKIKEYRR